jgi:outer membrane protein assembly factor BamA
MNPSFISLPIRLLFTAALVISAAQISAAQPARKIARIETEGLQAVSRENVISMTGLKIGEPFSVNVVDAAAQQLIDSGLFKNVAYRTQTTGSAVTITFQLEELKANSFPVVFDNFIWFSDEELTEVVKTVLPSFNGSVPDAGNSAELIRQALQKLLETRKMPGTIEYTLTDTGHLYRVGGAPLNICTLHFPGADRVPEQKLIETMKSSTDPNYSRQAVAAFPKYGLFPLYRELGHWKATFGTPVAKPDHSSGCEGGVDLTIPVSEGAAYSWARPEWSGNRVLEADELDAALGMKVGDVANGKKFDRGVHEVERAYGKHGHIQARLNSTPEFDDAAQRVMFKIAVNEGPLFRMGTVEFRGVSEPQANGLKERWKLKSGQIFDQSYVNRFFIEDAASFLAPIYEERGLTRKGSAPVDVRYDINRQAQMVNLVIEIRR